MKKYKGIIIEESLEKKDALKKVKILKTKVERVTKNHKTPWIKRWRLHTIEISEDKIDKIAKDLSNSIDHKHKYSWYVDFKNDSYHYIILYKKIFKVESNKKEQYGKVTKYGVSLGIPKYQLTFKPKIR